MRFFIPPLLISSGIALVAICGLLTVRGTGDGAMASAFMLVIAAASLPVFAVINLVDLAFDTRGNRWLWTLLLIVVLSVPGWLKLAGHAPPSPGDVLGVLTVTGLVILPMSVIRRVVIPAFRKPESAIAGSVLKPIPSAKPAQSPP